MQCPLYVREWMTRERAQGERPWFLMKTDSHKEERGTLNYPGSLLGKSYISAWPDADCRSLAGWSVQPMSTPEPQSQAPLELRAFIDCVPALVWTALPDGSVDCFNQQFTDYSGWSPQQIPRGSSHTSGVNHSRNCVIAGLSVLLIFNFLFVGCAREKAVGPSIEFSKIPLAAQGGRERVDTIAGRVRNARPGQQIVIYAHSGQWWVQPWPDRPFIPIKADSTWSTETHLGFEYAALLVEPDYHPLPTMDVAPTQGGSVALVTIVKGVGTPQLAPDRIA